MGTVGYHTTPPTANVSRQPHHGHHEAKTPTERETRWQRQRRVRPPRSPLTDPCGVPDRWTAGPCGLGRICVPGRSMGAGIMSFGTQNRGKEFVESVVANMTRQRPMGMLTEQIRCKPSRMPFDPFPLDAVWLVSPRLRCRIHLRTLFPAPSPTSCPSTSWG